MAINNYNIAIKKLLPQGSYWDNLLADSESDLNKIITAKSVCLATYRQRATDLKQEAFISTCDETMTDYERVYLNTSNEALSFSQRRALLLATQNGVINISILQSLAGIYGAKITRAYNPYTDCFFGHSFFGDLMASPAAKNVVFITAEAPEDIRATFETAIANSLLANHITYFFYGD